MYLFIYLHLCIYLFMYLLIYLYTPRPDPRELARKPTAQTARNLRDEETAIPEAPTLGGFRSSA